MQDSIPYYPDSNYHYPGSDTTVHNPGDALVNYHDTIPGYPGGDTIPHYPGDTIPNYPWQQCRYGVSTKLLRIKYGGDKEEIRYKFSIRSV